MNMIILLKHLMEENWCNAGLVVEAAIKQFCLDMHKLQKKKKKCCKLYADSPGAERSSRQNQRRLQ